MKQTTRRKIVSSLIVSGAILGTGSQMAFGQPIPPGYDLLATQPGTTFAGAPFMGVPLGGYNFGGTLGFHYVGNTDTIIQRLGTATSSSGPVPMQINGLQLESATPISFNGGPLGDYFITLQSTDGTGPASTGNMTINFGSPGTFTSTFDVFFDVHFGSLTGPIVNQGDVSLSNSGDDFGSATPPGAITIPGVNYLLDGTDTSDDFWPSDPFAESGNGATHVVSDATPEPATGALLLLSSGLFAWRRRHSIARR